MLVYRGMDVGTAKPTGWRASRRCRTTCSTSRRRASGSRSPGSRRRRARRSTTCASRGAVPLLVGGSGLYFRAVADDLVFPGEDPRGARRAGGARPTPPASARSTGASRTLDPWPPPRSSRATCAASCGRSRCRRSPARPFSAFAAAWERYDPARVRVAGIRIAGDVARRPHRRPGVRDVRARMARGGRGAPRAGASAPGSPRPRRSATRSSPATSTVGSPSRKPGRQRCVARRTWLGGRWRGSGGTRACGGSTRAKRGAAEVVDEVRRLPGERVSELLEFAKYQGAGNDFVMLVDLDDERPLDPAEVAALCDRRTGVGADGVIRVVRTDRDGASFFMDYANADGIAAEMCGNGIRCVGVLLHDRGLVDGTAVDVLTRAGLKHLTLHPEAGRPVRRVTVTMGVPRFTRAAIPMRGPAWETFLGAAVRHRRGTHDDGLGRLDGQPAPRRLRRRRPRDRARGPHRAGARAPRAVPRAHERRVRLRATTASCTPGCGSAAAGETMACGSGACAAAVAANEAGLVPVAHDGPIPRAATSRWSGATTARCCSRATPSLVFEGRSTSRRSGPAVRRRRDPSPAASPTASPPARWRWSTSRRSAATKPAVLAAIRASSCRPASRCSTTTTTCCSSRRASRRVGHAVRGAGGSRRHRADRRQRAAGRCDRRRDRRARRLRHEGRARGDARARLDCSSSDGPLDVGLLFFGREELPYRRERAAAALRRVPRAPRRPISRS